MAKAPKKPKKSASLATWQNYAKRKTEHDSDKKKKDAIIGKTSR